MVSILQLKDTDHLSAKTKKPGCNICCFEWHSLLANNQRLGVKGQRSPWQSGSSNQAGVSVPTSGKVVLKPALVK